MVGRVLAIDPDAGSNGQVLYSSSPQQLVTVDNVTGDVILLVSPDFETLSVQSLQVSMNNVLVNSDCDTHVYIGNGC